MSLNVNEDEIDMFFLWVYLLYAAGLSMLCVFY
jgi:hypothetical protein